MVHSLAPDNNTSTDTTVLTKARGSGVSGTVLDDLSGTYKTFAEAVKEVISNTYDADAKRVDLTFHEGFSKLTIRDDGAGMNPKQFVREYIRVGRSSDAKRHSPSGQRERIGGKGIGSLAPARYCRCLRVSTKPGFPLAESRVVMVPADGEVSLQSLFPYLTLDESLLYLFTEMNYQIVEKGQDSHQTLEVPPSLTLMLPAGKQCLINYTFAANRVWIQANIDFVKLRELGERIDLEDVVDLWEVQLVPAESQFWRESGTVLIMEDLEAFVINDLNAPGKPQARNISSKSGLDRFIWTLSRLCPVPVANIPDLQRKLPPRAVEMLSDREPLQVFIAHPRSGLKPEPLKRDVYVPHRPLSGHDASLCHTVEIVDPDLGLSVRGYVLGSSTIIYPAEQRGVSIRVKGVELGAPTLFGAEGLTSGPQHAALTNHITGELHLDGVDVRRDILPGREGLYPESPVYRILRRVMVGFDDRLSGLLRELVNEVLLRSEANASALGLIKRLESQRRALLDAASAIATMAELDEYMLERLMTPPENELQLLLYPDVAIRPEGRLHAYSIEYADHLQGLQYEVDYEDRRLVLSASAPYLERTVDLAGERFTVLFKQGSKERVFCEVDPDSRYLFINWDHPVRGAMGDSAYIKHCLAAVVCGLPQLALSQYVQLISNRS